MFRRLVVVPARRTILLRFFFRGLPGKSSAEADSPSGINNRQISGRVQPGNCLARRQLFGLLRSTPSATPRALFPPNASMTCPAFLRIVSLDMARAYNDLHVKHIAY
jgi:hypothetical protein